MGSELDGDGRRLLGTGTAALYDWSNSRYHCPVMTRVPNGFPLRKPVATEKKLRQMYLNSNTVCGRLLISSSCEAARQRRLAAMQREMDRSASTTAAPFAGDAPQSYHALATRCDSALSSRAGSGSGERHSRSPLSPERVGAPSTAAPGLGRRPPIPPINSAQGLTVVKKVLRRGTADGESRLQMHSQVDVYLPRAAHQPSRQRSESRNDGGREDSSGCGSSSGDENVRGSRQQPPPPLMSSASGRTSDRSRGRGDDGAESSDVASSERPITANW